MNAAAAKICVVAACLSILASGLEPARAAAPPAAMQGAEASTARQTIQDRAATLQSDLRNASDLRLRIVFSFRNVVEVAPGPGGGIALRTESLTSVATLVEQARGSTDPLLLDLLLHRCQGDGVASRICNLMDLARRWTEADTQNQIAWLALAGIQREGGDDAAARATFARAAQASQWHEHAQAVARLIADAAPQTLSVAERFEWLNAALLRSYITTTSVQQLLSTYCKEADPLRAACLKIVATSVRDGESLQTFMAAPNSAARAQAPESVIDGYRERGNGIYWATLEEARAMPDPLADLDDATARSGLAVLLKRVADTDRHRAENLLIAQHVSQAEASRLFESSLSTDARAAREKMLRAARAAGAVNAGSTRSTAASP